MAVSQNGYTYGDISLTTTYVVTKDGRTMRFLKGSPGEMLADFVRWFDENIRDIDAGILDDWSWAVREIRGGTSGSNHGSGTAVDINATRWNLGSDASVYLTAAEIAKVQTKLKEYRGCIRWGQNYSGRKDPMHFEIDQPASVVTQVWADIKAARANAGPSPIVKAMQTAMNYPSLGKDVDGYWGPTTDKDVYAIRQAAYANTFPFGISPVQRLVGSQVVDGVWGAEDEIRLQGVVAVFQRAWGLGGGDDGIWGQITERAWKSFQAKLFVS